MPPRLLEQLQIRLLRIAAIHAAENFIRPALKRQMQLMADMLSRCHRGEQPVRGVLRMACHKAQTVFPRHRIQPREQIGKIHADTQITAVGVDILS